MSLSHFPKITIVTPNYNCSGFLEKTILSVLGQNYPNLEYIIIDGGSNDGSLEIIKKYESQLAYWVSEKDEGIYDAINKGFSRSSGEIMGWINSDDLLWPGSLFNIATVFQANRSVNWIQGIPTLIDEEGHVLHTYEPVFSKYQMYLKEFLLNNFFIQQESTFWRRDLWEKAGSIIDVKYKVAGDFDLWMRFFSHSKLQSVNVHIGAFRLRKGQQSEDKLSYYREAECSLCENKLKLTIIEKFALFLLSFSRKIVKVRLNKSTMALQNWIRKIIMGEKTILELSN